MKKIREATVKWGIIGVGDVCEVKSAPAMNKIANSKIEAVMRRNAHKAEDYAKRHGIAKWYADADQLIEDSEVNAIYIATPPKFHLEYATKAAKAGKPVYVEKPMARTYPECVEMVKVFEEANLPLYVAYYRRMLPNFLKVKQLVDQGKIGDVRLVNIQLIKPLQPDLIAETEENWRVDPELAGGGYFYDLASHQLDFLDYLFGPIVQAKGYAANQGGIYKAEDIVVASFRFESGVMGSGSWCFNAGAKADEELITLIGSKGQIRFPCFGKPWVEIELDSGEKDRFLFQMPEHIQQPLIETVVADLLGTGNCPSTGNTGARTNLVMDLMAGANAG